MNQKFPHLCAPITLGRTVFRNRMFSAPMGGTDITADCCVGPRTPGFYELRAKGGAAAVTASELVVHPKTDASHMFHLDLQTPGCLASWTFLADAVARHGAVPSVELSHSGQYAGTYLIDKDKKKGLVQYGPSDWVRPDGIPVKALTGEQIDDIVKAYGETAALAKRAGFQMVMVHGGHGWLVNQFLSPAFNHRTDEYGGSLENRLLFARRVLQSVRDVVGPGFPIEFRMSGAEFFEGGYGIEEGIRIAQGVEDLVDLIHVSAGSYQFGFFRTHLPMFAPHGDNVWLAAEIKKHVSKPVATIGALNDPEQMEEIIASGQADVVEMARALLADPELPNKVMAGREDEIVHCLRCFTCMAERPTTGTRRCTVNPLIGRECEGTGVLPAARKKRVVVVGGGVGGMKAALTAAQRGHTVTLLEKSGELGGILKSEQALPFKYEMYRLGLTLARQMELPPFVIFQDPSLEDMSIQYPITLEEMQNITGVGAGKARKFGKPFIELIKKYVEEKDIIRPQDMVVKSVVNKSVNKVFIIQSIDRQMDFEDIAKARDMDFDELLTEIEAIVHSGTKLNIKYYIDETVDEDKAEEIYLYFKEDAETDSLEEAVKELGPDFTEEEIRLVRIQFMSEMGN